MNKREFVEIRRHLEKTQNQMAQILGVSPKAVQSFEQGWRKIPAHVERQVLFLWALKKDTAKGMRPCWEIRGCPPEICRRCPAWEFKAGKLCWFINGTICRGNVQDSWIKKMRICRKCPVFAANMKF